MSKVDFYAQGLGLKPLSADPSSPSDGQLYMSDGTARAAGLWRYSSTSVAWLPVGSGGGGLDVFHTEDFESNGASDFNTGNAATVDAAGTGTLDGTLADETSAPFSADASLKYTMGSTSANDFFLQDADISIELKQTSNDVGVSFYYTYNGDDDDIRFFALDQDDAELTTSIEYLKSASTPTRFTTSFYVPAGTTGIRYGFQVVTGNSAKILIVDDIELSLNPFVYKNLSNVTDISAAETVSITGTTSDPTKGTTVTDSVTYHREGQFAVVQIDYEQSSSGTAGSGDYLFAMPASLKIDTTKLSVATTAGGFGSVPPAASVVGTFSSGRSGAPMIHGNVSVYDEDKVRFHGLYTNVTTDTSRASYVSSGGSDLSSSSQRYYATFKVPIQGWYATAEHVVTPAKSNLTDWTAYTPTITGFGTASAVDFYYKQVGDSYHIQGIFTSGTSTAVEAQISLPNSKTIKAGITKKGGGLFWRGYAGASSGGAVIQTAGDAFLNLGSAASFASGSVDPLTIQNGSAICNSGDEISIDSIVPIEGLSSDATFLAAIPTLPVGTVLQSMLTEQQMNSGTYGTWYLMDGRSCTGTAYASITGDSTVPDAQGRFLRAKDAAGTTNPDGDVALGTSQDNKSNYFSSVEVSAPGGSTGTTSIPEDGTYSGYVAMSDGADRIRYKNSGDESRPDNITVNFFIRVN